MGILLCSEYDVLRYLVQFPASFVAVLFLPSHLDPYYFLPLLSTFSRVVDVLLPARVDVHASFHPIQRHNSLISQISLAQHPPIASFSADRGAAPPTHPRDLLCPTFAPTQTFCFALRSGPLPDFSISSSPHSENIDFTHGSGPRIASRVCGLCPLLLHFLHHFTLPSFVYSSVTSSSPPLPSCLRRPGPEHAGQEQSPSYPFVLGMHH